jgi:resuscitation-promoting factor RpfA
MARYRGRHRAPSTTGRTLARTAIAGAVISAPAIAAPAASADTGGTVWDRLAQCESTGNWNINTGNGFSGGLQFTPSTWRAFGGAGVAHRATREQQIAVAERVLAEQGWGAWPACSRKLGLHGTPPKLKPAPQAKPSTTVNDAVHDAIEDSARTGGTIKVAAGDTLSRLAAAHHVPGGWKALMDANPGISNPHKLKLGVPLVMPS